MKSTKNEMYSEISAVSANSYGCEIFDAKYKGGDWEVGAVETQETLEQWDDSKKYWNECSGHLEGTVAGFKFLGWSKVQIKKGEARRAVTVIDLGEFRIVLDIEPSYFN